MEFPKSRKSRNQFARSMHRHPKAPRACWTFCSLTSPTLHHLDYSSNSSRHPFAPPPSDPVFPFLYVGDDREPVRLCFCFRYRPAKFLQQAGISQRQPAVTCGLVMEVLLFVLLFSENQSKYSYVGLRLAMQSLGSASFWALRHAAEDREGGERRRR
jgi:hypothetical protein